MPYRDETGGGNPVQKLNQLLYGKYPAADEDYVQQVLAGMLAQGAMGGNTVPVGGHGDPLPVDPNRGKSANFRERPPAQNVPRSTTDQAQDEMDALFQQLLGMVGSSSGADVDYEAALASSEKAIRDAYAGEIGAIRGGNARARKDTAGNRRAIEKAYSQLAKTYTKSGKRDVKQSKKLANAMQNNSEQSANFVDKKADQSLGDMAALAQGLGIQDAMPQSSQPLVEQTADTVQRMVREGASDANRQLGFSGNNQRYMERGGQLARLEGTNRSTDLLADLQDYLQGNRDKIASLKGQRGRELAANESSVMGSVAEMQSAADNDMWDRLMQLSGLKMDIEREQFDQSSSLADYQLKLLSEGNDPQEAFPGAENFANAQNYLGQLQQGNKGVNIFDKFLNSQGMQDGEYWDDNANADRKMTPYAAMAQMEQAARQQGMSEQDIQLLRLAIWAQMG